MGRMKKLAVIGGGASGLAAAVAAARELGERGLAVGPDGDAEVLVFEADEERVGRSILVTGNGRCNFSNAHIDASLYRNGDFAAQVLDGLAAADGQRRGAGAGRGGAAEDPVCAFFADLGLAWREEAEGRLYPLANKASSLLDVLRAALRDAGGREVTAHRAVAVEASGADGGAGPAAADAPARLHIRFADGAIEHVDAVIVAVGGRAIGGLSLPGGLTASGMRPVLGPLRTDNAITRRLNNIRVRCAISLVGADGAQKARERGELLFRDYGVSGIAVFNLSRAAEPGDALLIDFLPFLEEGAAEPWLYARRSRMASRRGGLSCEDFLRGLVLPQLSEVLLDAAGLRADAPLQKAQIPALARVLTGLELEVRGIGDARQCQVARGGLDPADFDAATMGALGTGGLYAAGEALDVDGPCGGYNLHWAWASGIVAGRAAADRVAGA